MFRQLISILFIASGLMGCAVQSEDSALHGNGSELSRQFVQTVLLGAEYGVGGAVSRFTHSPRVSVFGADSYKKGLVSYAASQINSSLSGTGVQLSIGADSDSSADVLIYYPPMSQFPAIAQANGFEYAPGNTGFFWMFWNANHEISKSVVLIAVDQLDSRQLLSVTLEEMTQCLGPINDQSLINDSIFYESPYDAGYSQQLGKRDRLLLNFLYSRVRPGMDAGAVDTLFQRYWVE